jgi:fructokinase
MAIATLGSKGAMALLRRNDGSLTKVVAPIVDLPVKDTIGAGDAFHGAFLSWLEKNDKMSRTSLAALTETELYDALYFANKAASIVCTRQGAEPPTLKEVETLKLKKTESKSGEAKKAPPKTDTVKKTSLKAGPAETKKSDATKSATTAAKKPVAAKKATTAKKPVATKNK